MDGSPQRIDRAPNYDPQADTSRLPYINQRVKTMDRLKWMTRLISLVSFIAGEIYEAARDGKITIRELLDIAIASAERLGFDVDMEGLDLDTMKLGGK